MGETEQRHNHFNALRLLFASLVIVSHAPELHEGNRQSELLTRVFHTLTFGELAVDGFFLLSGYLITQSWDRQPRWWPFLKKRLLRIYPGFIAASLICAFVLGPWMAAGTYASEFSLVRFLRSVVTLGAPDIPPVFPERPFPVANGAMWTIQWEFRCYLAVLLVGCLRVVSFRRAWTCLAVLVFSLWTLDQLHVSPVLHEWMSLMRPSFWRFNALFLVGGCYYLHRHRLPWSGRGAALALLLLLPCMFFARLSEPALALFGGYLLFYVAHVPAPALQVFNRGTDISYGLYLYGWPMQNLLSSFWPQANVWMLLPFVFAGCVVMAFASWHAVEKPFLRLKQGWWSGGGWVRGLS